jgi:2-(1,2-epoxy-1,2-dihydrophenyl)acetyl-CoA isomerase
MAGKCRACCAAAFCATLYRYLQPVDLHQSVEIRPATIDDTAAIAPFHLACWQNAYSGLVPQDFIESLRRQDRTQRWRERLEAPHDETHVAVAVETVVGLATVGPINDRSPLPPVELRSLYVHADQYGTGLAQHLVEAALTGRAASLWVFEGNARARAFYGKHGWRPTGERRIDAGTRIPELRLARPEALEPG